MQSPPTSKSTLLPLAPVPAADAHWALLLDVDGTLLDFKDDPQAVAASPSLIDLLGNLHHVLRGALALVSGRAIEDIDRIFGHPGWAAAGLHGMELRHADGRFRRGQVSTSDRTRMRKLVDELVARFDGVEIEDKKQAIALHCRNDPDQLVALHAAAEALLPQLAGYELQPGRQVLEIKPSGIDKGQAVAELLEQPPFVGRVPVYLGDDLTDEHAFEHVNRVQGLSVRVGSREPTTAHFTLRDPAAAQAWLQRVLNNISRGGT